MSDRLSIRDLRLGEVDVRIRYFREASDEPLRTPGVDWPSAPGTLSMAVLVRSDSSRAIEQRQSYALVWGLTALPGFSARSTDHVFSRSVHAPAHDRAQLTAACTQFVRRSSVSSTCSGSRTVSGPNASDGDWRDSMCQRSKAWGDPVDA
jgi:hypothetical protein